MYLLKVISEFLNEVGSRPTWRVIVDALRSPVVRLHQLANEVEAAHFPDSIPIHKAVPDTPPTTGTVHIIVCLNSFTLFLTVTEKSTQSGNGSMQTGEYYIMYMHNTWHELCVYLHIICSPYGRRDAVTRRCCPYTGRDTASKVSLLRTRNEI